jgi:hypothetical protein
LGGGQLTLAESNNVAKSDRQSIANFFNDPPQKEKRGGDVKYIALPTASLTDGGFNSALA